VRGWRTWRELIKASAVPVPPEVVALGGQDPVVTYASVLERGAAAAYPQVALAAWLPRSRVPAKDTLARVSREHPDLDLSTVDIGRLRIDDTAREQLGSLVRVFRLSDDVGHIEALLTAGVDSAYSISRFGRDEFVQRFGGQIGTDDAVFLHRRAVEINAFALGLLSRYRLDVGTMPHAIGGGSPATAMPPDWAHVFGSVDFCACPDCRSVLSPAAYLADLLHFLADRHSATGDSSAPPLDVLLHRRPDLSQIELSCANTTTVLPMIDLINELCESRLTGAPAPVASHHSSEDLAPGASPGWFRVDRRSPARGGTKRRHAIALLVSRSRGWLALVRLATPRP
jgi:Salmonella virulence plasmid 28.1kDa A protein